MMRKIRKFLKYVRIKLSEQYLIFFFILTIGIKLYILNTFILKVTWSNEYPLGITCGFLSTAALFSPLILVRKHKNKIAVLLCFVISAIIFTDTVYYSYFSSLPSVGVLNAAGQIGDVGPALVALIKWTYFLYFLDILLVIIFRKKIKSFFGKFVEERRSKKQRMLRSMVTASSMLTMFVAFLLIVGSGNMFSLFDRSYDTKTTAICYGVLVAHGVDITRYIVQETAHPSDQQVKELSEWIKKYKPEQSISDLNGIAKGKNVIMIQVESLGGFVVGQTINGKEITPNLNELTNTAHYYPNDRFLYGAGHTSDTDFVSNTSYYPLDDAATFVRFGQDDFTSLPKTLTNNNYSSYAYHGFNRNFWNRDVALNSIGYEKFYAADNYKPGAKINMGLNDGDFLDQTADYIKDQPKPSLSYVITLSSHVPFGITSQTKELGLKPSDYPDQIAGYLENINYVDRMLGKFFDKLKKDDLYDDSLIVLYGDHNPVLEAFTAGTITYDPDSVQGKEVPLFIKLPNQTKGETHSKEGTHLDIMPTVLDLTGIKTNQLAFGRSLFADESSYPKVCIDQYVAFEYDGDCKEMLSIEKNKSATIIRYNLFEYLPK